MSDTTDVVTIVAKTAWMEARSGGKEGMQSVINVIQNRARNPRWWGTDLVSVCMKPWQFSSWNTGSTQLPLVAKAQFNGDLDYAIALNLADLAVEGILPDITQNADSYYATTISPPSWVAKATFTVEIAGQRFYRVELPPLGV